MRILQVGKYYPPFLGGMETVLENVVLGLQEAAQEVSVLVAGESDLERRETIGSGPHQVQLWRLGNLGVWNSQPLTPGLPAALRRLLTDFRPDIVHLHMPNPLLAMAWETLPAGSRPPCVIWHHADITRQKLGRVLVGPWVRRCLGRSRGVCVSSRSLLEFSSELSGLDTRPRVIPFGLDPAPWNTVASTFDGPFLFVGRLVPYKGLEVLVQAMTLVPGAELVLVGEGPLSEVLREKIQHSGLAGRVRLTGSLPIDRVLEIMSRARALVLPSLDASETFGLVQLEAMAAGLPVVISELPTGVGEVGLPDRTCLTVPPGRSDLLAASLARLQDDPELCRSLGRRGRERFVESFTRRHMRDALLAWYGEILDPRPA